MPGDHFSRRIFIHRVAAAAGASAISLNAQTVSSFGAKGDGRTLDTSAINQAIEAAAKADGGIVHFPAGTYFCHSIHLKSKVTLDLSPGCVILAADPPPPGANGGYDDAEPMAFDKFQDFGHSHFHNSLIWGEGLEDVGITGSGLIWGKGLSKGYGSERKAEEPHVGNKAISLKNCRNVTLRDFSILKGGHFGILVRRQVHDRLNAGRSRPGSNIRPGPDLTYRLNAFEPEALRIHGRVAQVNADRSVGDRGRAARSLAAANKYVERPGECPAQVQADGLRLTVDFSNGR